MKIITTGEGVALTLAARYGRALKKELEPDFRKTKHAAVRRVGTILVNQKGVSGGAFRAAEILANGVAANPLKITISTKNGMRSSDGSIAVVPKKLVSKKAIVKKFAKRFIAKKRSVKNGSKVTR